MTIYLIRHGETPDNLRRVLQMPDSPLSETGFQQAQKLAERLSNNNITRIYCSDYLRARQTADAINQYHNLEITQEPLLKERHFGDWRGKSYDEVAKDRLNSDLSPPNGENTHDFFARIAKAWDFIKQKADKTNNITVIVSHGLACRALVQNHLVLDQRLSLPGNSLPEKWSNTSLTIIEHVNDKSKSNWLVTKVNCAKHLE